MISVLARRGKSLISLAILLADNMADPEVAGLNMLPGFLVEEDSQESGEDGWLQKLSELGTISGVML